MGLKNGVLKRPYLLAKPPLATVITVRSPHTNGDSACAEQSSSPLSISGWATGLEHNTSVANESGNYPHQAEITRLPKVW
jgi:hypothetical protein